MNIKKLIMINVILVFIGFNINCGKATIMTKTVSTKQTKANEQVIYFFFLGYYPNHEIQGDDICGKDKLIGVHSEMKFLNGLLHLGTIGIVSPVTLKIYCGESI